ncbi:MAG: metal-dependent transcriptional regulator [Cellulosilyticaceae bacterium]
MLSSSLEEYLITIYEINEKEEEIKCNEVAKALNVPLKKAIQAIQRMHYQKYVVYSPYQPLVITEKGKKEAKYLLSRNQLIDEFLEILQITENIETEKESMRQYLSYQTLESIEKFVLFNRQYPEVVNRYKIFLKRKPRTRIIEDMPEEDQI